MARKCLMVETSDHRKFFTHPKNFDSLLEFSKIFGAEVSVVQTDENIEVLDLESLASSVCDPTHAIKPNDIKILEIKIAKPRRERQQLVKNAGKIQEWIYKEFTWRMALSLKDIRKKFGKLGLTVGCLSNHFAKVRRQLIIEGYQVTKIGQGNYKLN